MASGHLKTPHQQAEHMAAPTSPCDIVQKTLANSEPSTHGKLAEKVDRNQENRIRILEGNVEPQMNPVEFREWMKDFL